MTRYEQLKIKQQHNWLTSLEKYELWLIESGKVEK